MLKVTIEGQVYSYDDTSHPLAEAIELEEKLGMSYGEYQAALNRGSAKAMAGYIWTILKRNGRNVPLEDLLSGKYEVNTDGLEIEAEGDAENPPAAGPGSPTTGGATSGSSPKSSATPRVKSAS